MRTHIVVKLQVEGLHNWPEAKEVMPQMDFLSYPHRHLFYIEAVKEVGDWNREIEIIDFKRKIDRWLYETFYDYDKQILDFEYLSCEKLACFILKHFNCTQVSVLEDNENGAIVAI